MLGSGRPFIIELVNPKKKLSLTQDKLDIIQNEINKSTLVNLLNLRDGGCQAFVDLKKSEQHKIKMYCCMIATSRELTTEDIEKLNALENIELNQKTPLRVLHRRTLMDRKKSVFKLSVHKVNQFNYSVFVLASAGTYIKEFIHGDLERTLPNFGTLTNSKADIYQLDVNEIFPEYNEESLNQFREIVKESLDEDIF